MHLPRKPNTHAGPNHKDNTFVKSIKKDVCQ